MQFSLNHLFAITAAMALAAWCAARVNALLGAAVLWNLLVYAAISSGRRSYVALLLVATLACASFLIFVFSQGQYHSIRR